MNILGTGKRAKINLAGKNLIITGANGSGKTRFLEYLHQNVYEQVVSKEFQSEEELRRKIKS